MFSALEADNIMDISDRITDRRYLEPSLLMHGVTGPGRVGRKPAQSLNPPMGTCIVCDDQRQFGSVYCEDCEDILAELGWELDPLTERIIVK